MLINKGVKIRNLMLIDYDGLVQEAVNHQLADEPLAVGFGHSRAATEEGQPCVRVGCGLL